MAGINKLKATQIKNAKPGDKLEDGGGLRFIGTKSGGKWEFRFQLNGRRRQMGLGSFPQVSMAEARAERDKWAAVIRGGNDPITERERQRSEALDLARRADPTFSDMLDMTFDAIKDRLKNETAGQRWLSCLRHHIVPKIGHMPISTIHQRDIRDALLPIWKTKHETADKALYRSRMVFKQARLSGYDADPFVCDAARHMLGYVDHQSKPLPATPWQDIPALYDRLCQKDYPSYFALRFTILTAARGAPVRGARFDEIEGDVWTVPAERMKGTKGKLRDFRIPLSTAAMEVVDRCRDMRINDFLFPAPRANQGISDVAMSHVLNGMNEAGRTHGFRTSFRTWVQDTEAASYEVTETALSHIIGNKVERSYARSDLLDQRRILMQKWADFVTQSEAKVVLLRG